MVLDVGPQARAALEDLSRVIARRIPTRRATVAGVINSANRDNVNNAIRSVQVQIGPQEYEVPWNVGSGAPVGQPIEVSFDPAKTATPDWKFERFLVGNQPFPVLDDDATIPAPTISTLTTSTGTPTSGGLQASLVATIIWTEDKYQPERIEIQYASDADAAAGRWTSFMLSFDEIVVVTRDAITKAIVQTAWIGWLPLGTGYNVKVRTWTSNGARSPFSGVFSRITASDTTTPAMPVTFSVDLSKSLVAIVNLPQPNQPLVFGYYELSFASTGAGAGAQSFYTPGPQYYYSVGAVTDFYLRVREVTKAGVAGPWNPNTGLWSGAYHIAQSGATLDTTPPNTPVLSTVTAVQQIVQGVTQVTITATVNSYTFPSPNDFQMFEWRFYNGTTGTAEYPTTAAELVYRKPNAEQGVTIFVKVRAWDVNNNASPWSNEISVATPVVQTPSAPTITSVTAGFRGAVIVWSQVPDNTTNGVVRNYELQSSLDGTNFTQMTITDALRWVATGLAVGTLIYFRVRAINVGGTASAFSNIVSTTPTAIQDADFLVNTLNANKIGVGTLTGDRIQVGTIDSTRYGPGSITANALVSDLLLTSIIRAQGPDPGGGRIFAGNDTVLLWAGGLHIAGTQALKFITGNIETGTVRMMLTPVTNYAATGRSGVVLEQPSGAPDVNNSILFLRTRRGADQATNARWLELSDMAVQFVEQSLGFKGNRFDSRQWWDRDGDRVNMYRAITNPFTFSISGAANTGVDILTPMAGAGMPNDITSVVMRATITSPASTTPGFVYIFPGPNTLTNEKGIFLSSADARTQSGTVQINQSFGSMLAWSPTIAWTLFVSVIGYYR